MKPNDPEATMPPDAARRLLGISSATYFRWLREGKLRGVRVGRRWRFSRAALEALLRSESGGDEEVRRGLEQAVAAWRELLRARGIRAQEIEAMAATHDVKALARCVLEHAHRNRATAVHLEAGAAGWNVRERIDGFLVPAGRTLPGPAAGGLVADFKALAGLDPLPSSRAAQGRFFAEIAGRRVDVRAATFPTGLGESLTLRLLDPEWTAPRLEASGFSRALCAAVRALVRGPRGVFVVNGPTDSGKTTTLYSLLVELRRPGLKIMTAEDAGEVFLEGIQQANVGGPDGMGFRDAVFAMMRSEVDIAMVSEIRTDDMFAGIFSVASAGRRLFTALHAADAVGALHRMIEMGKLNGSWIADNLLGILDQRLVRVNCPDCRRRERLKADSARLLGIVAREAFAAPGCARCRQTGFRGRTAAGALLTVTPALRAALESGADLARLRAAAADQPGLRAALAEKVLAGDVAPAEALRVLPPAEEGAAAPSSS